MRLNYLHFDLSDAGGDDTPVSLDAMASVTAAHWPALQAELAQVLAWAHAQFPDGPGPLDEGHDWDMDLQATQERSRADRLRFDAASGQLLSQLGETELVRHSVSLLLSGTPAFCSAFLARFPADAE